MTVIIVVRYSSRSRLVHDNNPISLSSYKIHVLAPGDLCVTETTYPGSLYLLYRRDTLATDVASIRGIQRTQWTLSDTCMRDHNQLVWTTSNGQLRAMR